MLCELAQTDCHRFRILELDSDQTQALRALTRAREDLGAAGVAMANQLCSELERFWRGSIGLFSDLDSPISLAFIERYPCPIDAHRLGEQRLAAFLKARTYSKRKTAAQLLARLRQAPAGRAGEIETATRRQIVLALVGALQTMVAQIVGLDTQIARALDAHPDGEIFCSFFPSRDSVIGAATLLAEIGDCRARYPHRDAIAADGGQAPVAVESGKRKTAKFRWACNGSRKPTQTCLRCRTGISSATPRGLLSAETRERPGGPLRSTTGSLRVSSSHRLSAMSA